MKKKKLSAEELEEIENARIAEVEAQLAAEREEARYKHVLQLDFSTTTRDPIPSISPRDQLSYQGDKKFLKEMNKFREQTPELDRLLLLMRFEILKNKPNNIVRYLANKIFTENNVAALQEELKIDPLERKRR
jgi:hypothetical protein